MDLFLKDRVAVVTGAANGIGRVTAMTFAAEGAAVALVDLDETALEEVADTIRAQGGRALPVRADCSDSAVARDSYRRIEAELGPADILVNNVGQSARNRMTPFVSADLDTLDFLLAVNLKSCILWSRQVIEGMCKRRYGRIVNITSEAAVMGSPLTWDYGAAKAGVIGFTRALAREVAPSGVTVNAVGPGITRTRAVEQLPPDVTEKVLSTIPMKTMGEPEDIANAITFLASDRSRYVTGQTLLVNGGHWML
ncbi:SDR family NAD(P)-dependent oxidoreductase [Azospirillum soli]|uniref:SDR family NAD(P)-dependent oxidoreductase n=1 Tax=Azospirillum soli TaxID=1304799 RepID=UPI001AE8946A|nr:SDR family NAD(P)-dependent oxidoreductase [Azospirillum soli]MBP2316583.1 NAD(P)-dependent dehydrogenase (short-subunit alcohol dehydrogenase family) [Azospirillum soli]